MHAGKVIDPLIRFHSIELIALHRAILPVNIPVFVVIVGDFELIHLGAGSDHRVVAVLDVDDESLVPVLDLLFHNNNK